VLHRLQGSAATEAISAASSDRTRAIAGRSIDVPVDGDNSGLIPGRSMEPPGESDGGRSIARRPTDGPGNSDGGGAITGRSIDAPGNSADDDRGLPPAVAGWFEPDGVAVDDRAILDAWQAIRARHGVDGGVRFERAAGVRPRTFVVEPGREIIVVIPERVAAPAERFAVLHELGHAVAALALPAGIPRAVDEAAAAYIAAWIERDGDPWHSPLAAAARARRRALARALDRIERALPELPAKPLAERPPWALWHDAGAQAAYVAAETFAEALEGTLGTSPAPGALTAALATWRAEIDRLGTGTCAP
jgi:hypothetical protein